MTAWDVSTAVYENKFKDVSGQDTLITDVFFKDDGAKMYVMGYINKRVFQYSLSTPWDVSTAVYDIKNKFVGGEAGKPHDIFFKGDGTKMYVDNQDPDRVFQYSLSTPWDVSTAVYDTKFKDVTGEETNPAGIFFKDDGAKMYVGGYNSDKVHQYSLSTPWDVSTAVYDNIFKDCSGQTGFIYDIFFKGDGAKMYVDGSDNTSVYQYSLSTPWDVSTAVYENKFKDVSGQSATPSGIFFKDDGAKMYISGQDNSTIFQYDLPVVGTNMQINIVDVFKDVDSIKVNISDVWKDVSKIQINIGDAWKTVFG